MLERFWPVWVVFMLLVLGCLESQRMGSDVLLAQVYDKKLYASDVATMIPENSTLDDSILLQNAFIERWIKESLIMHEAEKNIPIDLEIDKLVEDYRSSLVLNQYEKRIVDHLLDTVINENELVAHYEANQASYLLESIIVQCRLIKVPRDTEEELRRRIQQIWKSEEADEIKELIEICEDQTFTFLINDSLWYQLNLIQNEMPEGSVNEDAIRNNREFQLTNDNYYYFLKILDSKDKKEVAPLTYIQSRASKVILHQRKIELLAKVREDLYEQASSRNQIKLFVE